MVEHGNLIVTARKNEKLIGVSRSLTDFQFCTYLSDLAVDIKYQKLGIGKFDYCFLLNDIKELK